jgi:tRNA threonylcarbamoyladenosine biosynthesis protein TsaB
VSDLSLVLAIDTATRTSVVVVGRASVLAVSRRAVGYRHGTHLLEQLEEALAAAGATLDQVSALAVGTGPGSFTGLRVGLATAKTIAYARELPLVGLRSTDVLRLAACSAGAPADSAVVLPAGARDHYLALADADPQLVAPGGLAASLAGQAVVAVDVETGTPDRSVALDAEAIRLGAAAVAELPAALLAMARARLREGPGDDVAELTPAYVALPRGVRHDAEELGWSPDLQ